MDPITSTAPFTAKSHPQSHISVGTSASSVQPKSQEEYYAIWDEWEKNNPMGGEEKREIAVQRLKDCLQRQDVNLDLFSLNLSIVPELPPHILCMELSNNKLTELPQLPSKLDTLSVNRNRLISLPALPNSLLSLRASHNHLTQFPNPLPSALIGLDLSDNDLKDIPESCLSSCSSDSWIDVEHNPLSEETLQWLTMRSKDHHFQGPKIHFTMSKEEK